MRDRIKSLALDLLIERGYRGVSFGDLAQALEITRATIHYHYGSKQLLVEEVLQDYTRSSIKQLREIWTAPDASLLEKIEATAQHSQKRYLKYNPKGKTGKPWSLVTQLRQDTAALSDSSRRALQRYSRSLNDMIVAAVDGARDRGEFVSWMPVHDVALQLVAIANSSGAITQDAGNFTRLEQLYSSFARIITLAFGHDSHSGREARGGAAVPAAMLAGRESA